MNITADTNVLVRAITADDPVQAAAAQAVLARASLIAVPTVVLCETVWVLRRAYRYNAADIARAVAGILATETVRTDHATAAAGLAALRDGADFADGVVAYQGAALGGEVLASFDRAARRTAQAGGYAAADPAELAG